MIIVSALKWTAWFYISVKQHLKEDAGMANSVDPNQTASKETVWSGSALLA